MRLPVAHVPSHNLLQPCTMHLTSYKGAHLEVEVAASGAAGAAALLVQARLPEPVVHLPLLGVCKGVGAVKIFRQFSGIGISTKQPAAPKQIQGCAATAKTLQLDSARPAVAIPQPSFPCN